MSVYSDILQKYWGYSSFRPLQEEIIRSVGEKKDTLGLMPTGGGKSITFQVPTMGMDGICLVVTPLIALMKDQVDNLKKRKIKAAAVYTGMSREEIIVALENCIFGDYKFLYVSPERLTSDIFLNKLRAMNVCLLTVDEAHCISQWGYDFRPSYLQIAEIRKYLPDVPLLALTATATPEVVKDIQQKLLFKKENVFQKSFARKNLAYIVRKTDDKINSLIQILTKVPGSSIVYVRSRKKTKEVADELIKNGISADYFHAGLLIDVKEEKQNNWKTGKCRVIVSTNAFGMGIDKPDVRSVIHLDLPNSPEEYFQEAGRAGRDEKKAYAVILYDKSDSAKLKKRIPDEFPDREFVKRVYEALGNYFELAVGFGFENVYDFDLNAFCYAFKFPILPTLNALKILEQSGYIEYVEDPGNRSRLMFTILRDDLYKLKQSDPQTEKLISVLLRSYTGLFSDYAFIHEKLLATRSNMSPKEVYDRLVQLSKAQIISYIPQKKMPIIVYTQSREEQLYLSIPKSVYEERKERLEKRIGAMSAYAENDRVCRAGMLLRYFGETDSPPCGICDVCIARKEKDLSVDEFSRIEESVYGMLKEQNLSINQLVDSLSYPSSKVLHVIRFLTDKGMLKNEKAVISLKK
ncbi:MAG: RecQ family ATP-dependent DNA helicase [Candidatus Azobacteroides sp.]|nr:RecQ family ATP-dependent DNA helicase [Candidatus Azobacteroides sp.]